MDKRVKQRLIGAAVLVALAVIFVPMLLQGPVTQDFSQVPIEIPPQPVVTSAPGVPAPEPRPPVEPVPTPVIAAAEPAKAPEAVQTPKPAPQSTSKPAPQRTDKPAAPAVADQPAAKPGSLESWVVQVGSFSVDANAQGLRDKLRRQGYPAFVDRVASKDRTFYRVRIGPIAKRDEAERVRAKIEQGEGLKGRIMAHP